MTMSRKESLTAHLAATFKNPFRRAWPEWLGGLGLGVINVMFYAWADKPFTIYTGYWAWGSQLWSSALGYAPPPPLFERTSVGDIGLLLGALLAAALAGEFKLRLPRSRGACLEAVAGGLLMAIGVVLAFGCNWGGFVSAITALSLHGYGMLIGLIAGGYVGARYVAWRAAKELQSLTFTPGGKRLEPPAALNSFLKAVGVSALLALAAYYALAGAARYLGILLLGALVGVIMQRSRFCFTTAFRDLLNPEGECSRAIRIQRGIVVMLLVGVTGVAILKSRGFVDLMGYVKPVGLTNVVGGFLFGLGMVLAGACASGMLWRVGEGHVTQMIALVSTVLAYPLVKWAVKTYAPWILARERVLVTAALGWIGGMAALYASLLVWLALLAALEYKLVRVGV